MLRSSGNSTSMKRPALSHSFWPHKTHECFSIFSICTFSVSFLRQKGTQAPKIVATFLPKLQRAELVWSTWQWKFGGCGWAQQALVSAPGPAATKAPGSAKLHGASKEEAAEKQTFPGAGTASKAHNGRRETEQKRKRGVAKWMRAKKKLWRVIIDLPEWPFPCTHPKHP